MPPALATPGCAPAGAPGRAPSGRLARRADAGLAAWLAAGVALLAGCAAGPRIDTRHTAQAQGSRVQHIVLHYTVGGFASAL